MSPVAFRDEQLPLSWASSKSALFLNKVTFSGVNIMSKTLIPIGTFQFKGIQMAAKCNYNSLRMFSIDCES